MNRIGKFLGKPVCVVAFALCCASAQAAPLGVHAPVVRQESSGSAVSTDHYFEFHSGFWINLHHFLYEEALMKSGAPDARHEAEQTSDASLSASLSADEKSDWDAAVRYYEENLISLDLLTNDRMRTIKTSLENRENDSTLAQSHLEPGLVRVLDRAAFIYRERWWPAHDRANRDWIAAVSPLVDADGASLSQKLATAYESPWPDEQQRVDVVAYANWAGAYTTAHPDRIAISSLDARNQKMSGLEVLFHEASHTMIEGVANLVIQDFAAHKRNAPADLWHAILYFTTGYYLKELHPEYVTYADQAGLWKQAKWPAFEAALIKDWQPHLEGKSAVPAAVSELVSDVVAPPAPVPTR